MSVATELLKDAEIIIGQIENDFRYPPAKDSIERRVERANKWLDAHRAALANPPGELDALRAFRDRVMAAVEFVEPLAPSDRTALESAVVADCNNGMSLRKCAEKHGTTLSVVRTILAKAGGQS